MMCKIVQRVSRVLVVRMRTFGLRAVERRELLQCFSRSVIIVT